MCTYSMYDISSKTMNTLECLNIYSLSLSLSLSHSLTHFVSVSLNYCYLSAPHTHTPTHPHPPTHTCRCQGWYWRWLVCSSPLLLLGHRNELVHGDSKDEGCKKTLGQPHEEQDGSQESQIDAFEMPLPDFRLVTHRAGWSSSLS